jgi:pimeloyl-ACP methyl ester carboxylesterase
VHAPTLILAAEHDEVIPRIHTERLQQRFPPGIVVTRVIRGTDHNSISEAPEYLSLIAGR